ncbi:MAG: NYN domain-containing protein [Carboxydocellales bacterium]
MEDVLIIDGYNVIFGWPQLAKLASVNFEDARYKLLNILQNFQGYRGNIIVVVFDAHRVKGNSGKREQHGNLLVIYTAEDETADSVIERLVPAYFSKGNVFVVTSDWDEQRLIFGQGAYRIPTRELWEMIDSQRLERESQGVVTPMEKKELAQFLDEETRRELEKWRREK